MQIRLTKDEYLEMINSLDEGLKESKFGKYLTELNKEIDKAKTVENDDDVVSRISAIENSLSKLTQELQLIKNSYLYTYIKKINLDYIDVMELKKFHVERENENKYIVYYLDKFPKKNRFDFSGTNGFGGVDKFPKKNRFDFSGTNGFGGAMCYKIHEFLDTNNLYPKPNLTDVNVTFETIYDESIQEQFRLDNDNLSMDYIRAAINALHHSGLVLNDKALNLSYAVKSTVTDIKKEYKNVSLEGLILTKITIEKNR